MTRRLITILVAIAVFGAGYQFGRVLAEREKAAAAAQPIQDLERPSPAGNEPSQS